MTFNFDSYLPSLFPDCHYSTEQLKGGLVNITVRASRIDSQPSPGPNGRAAVSLPVATERKDCACPRTLILKYAPPFIAAIGEKAPCSQTRQIIEATVLELFGPQGPLDHLNTADRVRIARLINHDPVKSVLVFEDLGRLITLWDLFSPATVYQSSLNPIIIKRHCTNIGHRLGSFYADVHSPDSLSAVRERISESDNTRFLDRTVNSAFNFAVKPILERLQKPGGLDATTAEKLYARVHGDFVREPYPGETCLSMGDFHPGSVLVNPLRDWTNADSQVEVGAIDWEFATVHNGRGANGDMAQFLASFHALLWYLPLGTLTHDMVGWFVKELCQTYATQSGLAEKTGKSKRVATNPAMGLLRSAMILFGRETINQAIDFERDNGSRVPVVEMVKAGAWYLERAGNSVEEMLEPENWAELMKEEMGIMLRLFGIEVQGE
ncbi:hypothetical protein B0T22DRAFT_63897 [Podospora appendiculata]|uniref:Aminoglycoside phosphotransferase domain-containing protein n=1 Tax=Podospora appendiculata TaxID=314037 RepID=A0AAE0XIS3_9PEZI|nr:hypothetical protein B0T22DRAFT_63897 [Podospora appendiculata]